MAVYTNDLRLTELATGEGSGTWGTTTNTNLSLIADSFGFGTEAITTNADTHTTTIADGSADAGRAIFLQYTGTLDSTCTITIGPNTVSKLWFIENATSGSQSIIIKQGSGATVTIANGQTKAIYSDGAGSGGAMVDALQDLSIPDLFIDDDLTFTSDSAVITFGADGDTTLTHTDGSGLTLNSTNKIMFNDASQFIQGSSATVLSLGATDEIDLTATLIDINGNADVSGTVTATGTSVFTNLDISGDIDVDGTTNLDVVDIDGAVQIDSTLTVGVNDTGYDVKLFGATSGKNLLWDASEDALIVTGTTTLVGTTNLDAVDIDGAVQIDSTLKVGVNDTGYDVKFFGDTSGKNLQWDASADSLIVTGTADFIGTTNLDVVDIDGAVDFASTTTHAGNASFADNAKAVFGAGSDLQIFHDGSASFISDQGTGNLKILATDLQVRNAGDSGTLLTAVDGGAVTLKFNSNTKLATTNTGVDVTGGIAATSDSTFTASSGDIYVTASTSAGSNRSGFRVDETSNNGFEMAHDNADNAFFISRRSGSSTVVDALKIDRSTGDFSLFEDTGTTAKLFFDASAESLGIGTSSPAYNLQIDDASSAVLQLKDLSNSGSASIFFADSAANAPGFIQYNNSGNYLRFGTNGSERVRLDSSGNLGINQASPTRKLHVTSSGSGVVATFGDSEANNTLEVTRTTSNASYSALLATSAVGGFVAGPTMAFSTSNSGGGSVTERARFDSSGNFMVNTTTQSGQVSVDNGGNTTGVYVLQSSSSVNHTGISVQNSYVTGSQTGTMIRFIQTDGSTVGTISSTTSATAYNTSSDQRLKDNIVDAPSASAYIDAIQVRSFDWKGDGLHQKYGMVAQELSSVAPEAVTGDADSDEMMGVDYSKLVPMMMKEIQSLRARVAQLEGEN